MKAKIVTIAIAALVVAAPAFAGWVGVFELHQSQSITARCPAGYRIQAQHEDMVTSGRDLLLWCALPSPTPLPPLQSPLAVPVKTPVTLSTMPTQ